MDIQTSNVIINELPQGFWNQPIICAVIGAIGAGLLAGFLAFLVDLRAENRWKKDLYIKEEAEFWLRYKKLFYAITDDFSREIKYLARFNSSEYNSLKLSQKFISEEDFKEKWEAKYKKAFNLFRLHRDNKSYFTRYKMLNYDYMYSLIRSIEFFYDSISKDANDNSSNGYQNTFRAIADSEIEQEKGTWSNWGLNYKFVIESGIDNIKGRLKLNAIPLRFKIENPNNWASEVRQEFYSNPANKGLKPSQKEFDEYIESYKQEINRIMKQLDKITMVN